MPLRPESSLFFFTPWKNKYRCGLLKRSSPLCRHYHNSFMIHICLLTTYLRRRSAKILPNPKSTIVAGSGTILRLSSAPFSVANPLFVLQLYFYIFICSSSNFSYRDKGRVTSPPDILSHRPLFSVFEYPVLVRFQRFRPWWGLADQKGRCRRIWHQDLFSSRFYWDFVHPGGYKLNLYQRGLFNTP